MRFTEIKIKMSYPTPSACSKQQQSITTAAHRKRAHMSRTRTQQRRTPPARSNNNANTSPTTTSQATCSASPVTAAFPEIVRGPCHMYIASVTPAPPQSSLVAFKTTGKLRSATGCLRSSRNRALILVPRCPNRGAGENHHNRMEMGETITLNTISNTDIRAHTHPNSAYMFCRICCGVCLLRNHSGIPDLFVPAAGVLY